MSTQRILNLEIDRNGIPDEAFRIIKRDLIADLTKELAAPLGGDDALVIEFSKHAKGKIEWREAEPTAWQLNKDTFDENSPALEKLSITVGNFG